MKIVVVGGTGLIGKKLVKKLSQNGHELVHLVNGVPYFIMTDPKLNVG